MGIRRQAREAALQALYLADVAKMPIEDAILSSGTGSELPDKVGEFGVFLARGAAEVRPELDQAIMKYAENWELHRMAAVDRNILRLAAYELLHYADTPISVVIDEAVEIAKRYSTQDSGKFVNGILDKIKLDRADASPRNGDSPA
jgi:transcription antitermination protein NusB